MDNNTSQTTNNNEQPTGNTIAPEGKRDLKKQFLQVLIACVLAASGISVVAVLIGGFNEVLQKSLWTVLTMALHTVLSLGYVNYTSGESSSHRRSTFFTNVIFGLIVASFVTSILGIWGIFSNEITARMYSLFAVILFADVHAELLDRFGRLDKKIDNTIYINYVLMSVVVFMLGIVVFTLGNVSLGTAFYRVLSAFGILDTAATLSVSIMYKIYAQKHPEIESAISNSEHKKSIWRNPLIILLAIWLMPQLFIMVFSLIFSLAAGFN